ncbi:MAG: histidine ammonia-lyase [Candidatus Promineifilaceae bacterium]|nr:histidine ammonia-lyase [Candidatus Promineifilaceae bacterium]
MKTIVINGHDLQIDEVVAVANGRTVALDPQTVPVIQRSRDAVDRLVNEGRIAYGITTGFGRFKDKLISPEQVHQLQLNLVRSHAVGVGPIIGQQIVRAMLLVRANTLALGHSGVRPEIVQLLLNMLNCGVHPYIPSQGSLGASGDLAPLAHMALVMIGEGQAYHQGELFDGRTALARAGLAPVELKAKEGLALINGTTFMVGMGALQVRRAINLVLTADIAACLSLEALKGTGRAYDLRVHQARPHPRQIDCANFLCRIISGSQFLRDDDPNNVQDPYTLRCVPQVHGAVRDAIAYAEWVINIELNAANDNPLIFVDEESGHIDVISAGNFHGEPIALAMDYMKLAVTDLGNMSERRISRLVDADTNGGILPMFLTENGGLESGLMLAQYTAAALASENKVLAHPASSDTISSSANVEDHVSMGATAGRHMKLVLDHVETIVAIELLTAAQGIDFRRKEKGVEQLGSGSNVAYELIRKHVPFLSEDAALSPYIETVRGLVASGRIKTAVEKKLGL